MREHKKFSITTTCCLMLTTLPDYQTTALDNPFTVGPKAVSQVVVKKSSPKKLPPKRATSSIYDTNQVEKMILYRQGLQKRKQHDTVLLQEAKRKAAISERPSIASPEDQTLLQYTSTRSLASRSGPGLLTTHASTASKKTSCSRIVAIAMKLVGCPYKWSGTTPNGFDCSGFVQYVFQQAGIPLPRTSFDQYRVGTAITIQNLEPGDLVFFSTYASGPSHVGIYAGNGSFIQCLNSNTGVVLSRMDDPYYLSCFVGARRITS